MGEVVPGAQQEFWRPPIAQRATVSASAAEVCEGCGSEFIVGSRYCHICGTAREITAFTDPHWARHLELHNIKQGLGLPLASLIAFIGGVGCILAALACGLIYSERNVLEWEAVQAFRIQWLLAAVAAFTAGLLLKKSFAVKR
ncbi:MAG TPA: hypothetical protein VKB77_06005 [Terriglobales bacterium]|nr:hypothetical protein [Terriglobales bacterium]HKD45532.1 hypothetical protein [Candidatus Angelobacter sp.]